MRRPPGGHRVAGQRFAGSVAFAAALTAVCQLSSVACWVRLTSVENCSTAWRLPFTPRSNRPRPASIAAFWASNAALRAASLWVDQCRAGPDRAALVSST